jgi:hypothetical protein
MGSVRLWFGDADMLQVTYTPGRETYERMPFANIQAIMLTETKSWQWRLGIWGGLVVLIGLLCLAAGAGIVEIGFALFVPLLFLIVELVRGRTCECYVLTGVERYRLYPWTRRRKAIKGIRLLSDRVKAAQEG